ncbi:polysaccharide biosynthesis protein [Pradoshia eiseniae]|uniref:Polysaccharide biosynthesis protein n=1 Tax=Pradoshia eiseniae TaxID=2064768 RepID=A0A2S7MW38_9BACI|nr:oligosaccharide flippase family protein [Pradoshia eiseniae]PQD93958.1 polysaccharide biosynthesis protein [Pradoshia eiseniae]
MDREYGASRRIARGAAILAAAAIFVKILSAIYRVPFQNIAGDEGFYIYQQVYPIYGIIIVLATYGFPAGISSMMAPHDKGGRSQKELMTASLLWVSIFGLFGFLLLYMGAEEIALLMNDSKLVPLIEVTAFSMLLLPLVSCVRGFYQSSGYMLPTAFSQTIEQIVRVSVILIGSFILVEKGSSLYEVGEGAMKGSIYGGIAATFILLYFVMKDRDEYFPLRWPSSEVFIQAGRILLFQGLAFCLSNMYILLLQLIDSFQLYAALVDQGIIPHDAKILKGTYDRGQPLVQVGLVITTSMALSVVPVLSSLKKRGSFEELKNMCQLIIKISIIIGLAAAVGLAAILSSVNVMLFKDDQGQAALTIISLLIVFASVAVTSATILQTLGRIRVSVIIICLSVGLKAVMNPLLIADSGILGAAWSSLLATSVAAVALLAVLSGELSGKLMSLRQLSVMAMAVLAMFGALIGYTMIFSALFEGYLESRWLSAIHALSAVLLGVVVYLPILVKMKLFSHEELQLVPFGDRLVRLLPHENN